MKLKRISMKDLLEILTGDEMKATRGGYGSGGPKSNYCYNDNWGGCTWSGCNKDSDCADYGPNFTCGC